MNLFLFATIPFKYKMVDTTQADCHYMTYPVLMLISVSDDGASEWSLRERGQAVQAYNTYLSIVSDPV